MKLLVIPTVGSAILAGISLVTPAMATVNIDYVTVGDAGNAADISTGSLYGAVAYAYQIAKNETTIAQYAEFLNAAAQTDSYGLYSASMTDSHINGISQSGVSGSFTYSVPTGSANKPITFVSWFDAARFTNWLQNGQQTGLGAALSAETGAYTLNGATSGIIVKNVGATIWIPTEDEWYKAAYYDPNQGGVSVGGYWQLANQSNTGAGNTIGVASSANYFDGDYVGSGTAIYPTGNALTDVGAYGLNSASAYGTNDQTGNVYELNDAVISGSMRGRRGGSWYSLGYNLFSSSRYDAGPWGEYDDFGFRVASVPEPATILLTMLAGGVMLIRRKR